MSEITLQLTYAGRGEPRLSTETLIDPCDDSLDAMTDDDLQDLAAVCKAEAERCYAEAREWNRRAGEYRERLNRISQAIMEHKVKAVQTKNLTSVV